MKIKTIIVLSAFIPVIVFAQPAMQTNVGGQKTVGTSQGSNVPSNVPSAVNTAVTTTQSSSVNDLSLIHI